MIRVQDVLYLLDLDDRPIKSIRTKSDLSIEHVDDESSVMTVSLPMDEAVIAEQQFIYRKNRYIITEIEISKNERKQVVTAEIDYLRLNDVLTTVNKTAATVKSIADEVLKNSEYKVRSVAVNPDKHSVKMEDVSVLSVLRWVANISELKLRFDTLNREIYYDSESDGDIGFLFQYRKNLQDITKRVYMPKATTLIPYGKDGLTIASVNDGKNYVEDFSYYESLGYTTKEARQKFNKIHTLEDERFIYAGDLMREAQKQLKTLSRPQIAYEVSVAALDKEVKVGQYGYILDEELGIKVNVKIVRLIEHENLEDSEVELNYLIPDIATTQDNTGVTDSKGGLSTVLVDNSVQVIVTSNYTEVNNLSFTVRSATNAAGNFAVVGEMSQQGIINATIDIDGKPLPYRIREICLAGPKTLNLGFVATQIQEGSHVMRVMMTAESGTFKIAEHDAHLFLQSEELVGGMSAELPNIDVVEDVIFPASLSVSDTVLIALIKPTPITIEETVTLPKRLAVQDECTITLQ